MQDHVLNFCLRRGGVRSKLDDRQITHLICVCLKHLLYDFLGGVLGLLYKKQQEGGPKAPPKKSYSKFFWRKQIRLTNLAVVYKNSEITEINRNLTENHRQFTDNSQKLTEISLVTRCA